MTLKNKINWEFFELIAVSTLLIFGVILAIFSARAFYSGYHNVDLVFNEQYIFSKFNESIDGWYDIYNSNGDTISLRGLYAVGLEYMELSFGLGIVSGLMIGSSLLYIITKFHNRSVK